MTDAQTVRDLLADGIATAVAHDGDIALKWIAVIETIDEKGGRCMWRLSADDMTQWDSLALHEYALTKLRAEIMRVEVDK